VGLQEVRWDKEGTVRAGDYNFFMGKEMILDWLQTALLLKKDSASWSE
jgi:hypothetical protein